MDYILVLGSKPGSKLPNQEVSKIYTANGAAERAEQFRKKFPNNELTTICGAREFARNDHVSKRIIKSKPKRFIIRSGIISLPKDLKNLTKLICLSNKEQWNFQKNFFKLNKYSLFFAEFFHQDNFLQKMKHIMEGLKNNTILGVSTGFYAILLALKENPNSQIIISGIGMKGGKQFYKSERSNYYIYDSRAKVDRFLINKLKKDYKKRLLTLDDELNQISSINKWGGEEI